MTPFLLLFISFVFSTCVFHFVFSTLCFPRHSRVRFSPSVCPTISSTLINSHAIFQNVNFSRVAVSRFFACNGWDLARDIGAPRRRVVRRNPRLSCPSCCVCVTVLTASTPCRGSARRGSASPCGRQLGSVPRGARRGERWMQLPLWPLTSGSRWTNGG